MVGKNEMQSSSPDYTETPCYNILPRCCYNNSLFNEVIVLLYVIHAPSNWHCQFDSLDPLETVFDIPQYIYVYFIVTHNCCPEEL